MKTQKIKFLLKDGVEDGNEIGTLETTIAEMVSSEDAVYNGMLHDAMDAEVGNIIVSVVDNRP